MVLSGGMSRLFAPASSCRASSSGCVAALLLVAVAVSGTSALLPNPATAQSNRDWVSEGEAARHVTVTLFKSRTFRLDRPFATAAVGSADIVDALPMSDRTLYIQGKKIGTTNISVFDTNMRLMGVLDVEVTPDTGNVQQKIRATTGDSGIRVASNNGQIVLTGIAGNAAAADKAVAIAKSLLPESGGGIVNAMQVAPSQQVMLRVRFLEASRTASRELGANWFVQSKNGRNGFQTGLPGPFTTNIPNTSVSQPLDGNKTGGGVPLIQALPALLSGSAPFATVLAQVVNNNRITIDGMLQALEQKGLIRTLAEPDLVALSGDTAAFLAGGEFPVPTVQPGGSGSVPVVTTQYQPFGIQLTFMPTVLANGIINLRLAPSVSELDFANAVVISGTVVPSLTKREARTTVELRDGQSFAIAGLLATDNRKNLSQVPWIGSVPVLGALFRSDEFQSKETDLVVIVTPHLVQPIAPGQKVATPFDNHIPTNDVDFFLMGQMEQRKKYVDYVTAGGGVAGPYGHMIPSPPVPGGVPGGVLLPPPGPAVTSKY
jgi:pilus assembly protein CpaC